MYLSKALNSRLHIKLAYWRSWYTKVRVLTCVEIGRG